MATSALFEKEQRHELKVGGCDIWAEDPTMYCFSCGHKWGRLIDENPNLFQNEKASYCGRNEFK